MGKRWTLCGLSTLPFYRSSCKGGPMTWGAPPYVLFRPSTCCSSRLKSCQGRGKMTGEQGERDQGPAGKFGSSLKRGLWGLCRGGQKRHTSDKNIIPHARSGSQSTFPSQHSEGQALGLDGLSLCGWWQGVGRDGAGMRREGGRQPPLQCARMNSKELFKTQL